MDTVFDVECRSPEASGQEPANRNGAAADFALTRSPEQAASDGVNFELVIAARIAPALARLSTRLMAVAGLNAIDREVIFAAAARALRTNVHRKLCRTLALALNAEREAGHLQGDTSEARWDAFIRQAMAPSFWKGLHLDLPTLEARVDRLGENFCSFVADFARHWAADADALRAWGLAPGVLVSASFGAGDSHRGGRNVVIVECPGAKAVYKPRSLQVDLRLAAFVREIIGDDLSSFMRVPEALDLGDHGWTRFVSHVRAADVGELASFYRGVGHWLAVMRLLGGTDLHAENLIANRGSPVIVDCETLFTPKPVPPPTGLGAATDIAQALMSATVMSTGLLPSRGRALGWRGVDVSGLGALPGQQPMIPLPDLIEGGTDRARIGQRLVPVEVSQNHPSIEPMLREFWPQVLAGFDELSAKLRQLDAEGTLEPRLQPFRGCEVRVVTRATEVYAELARMLWHPVSLHDEPAARERAGALLAKMAENVPIAPNAPDVIAAEIEDLLVGDIPYFCARAEVGRMEGPGGTQWLERSDLVDTALRDWRAADLRLEHDYMRAALVSAFVNEAPQSALTRHASGAVRREDLDRRRRALAADLMGDFSATATFGGDGTVTWIAPTLTSSGWTLQPIGVDLYGGLCGVALTTAAYLREAAAGRADPVASAEPLLGALLRSVACFEDKLFDDRAQGDLARPPALGGYIGLGSQIWTRLTLDRWGAGGADGLDRALRLADGAPAAAKADESLDVLAGCAGAIPPLLALARRTSRPELVQVACELGDLLIARSDLQEVGRLWRGPQWPNGLGGFAHGATGMGWALAKLARASGEARFTEAAHAAFRFEDTLFDEEEANWLDLRGLPGTRTSCAWCHGCVGIGLAHIDLDPELSDAETRRIVRRAVDATYRLSFGWGQCACHGDAGALELLQLAIEAGTGPEGLTIEDLTARFVSDLEKDGPRLGSQTELFQPGLMSGQAGVVFQLLKLHAESKLPSFLTLSAL